MNNRDISKEWFKMAELDFDSAKFLLNIYCFSPSYLTKFFPKYMTI